MIHLEKKLYFAYGSNMDDEQMNFRCPDAQVVEAVRLEGYCLAFRSNGGGQGVATILPDQDSHVDGRSAQQTSAISTYMRASLGSMENVLSLLRTSLEKKWQPWPMS